MTINAQKNITRLGIALALVFWVVDAWIQSLVSEISIAFMDSLLHPETERLWLRTFVVLLFLIFSAYAERLLNIINKMTKELKQSQEKLEYTVTELQMEATERQAAIKELEMLAVTDPLTTLINRRKFNELLSYEIERNHRYHADLSLIMCDIDHFKQINDSFGHDVGDRALKIFSEKIRKNIREVDIFARWGGEEFMILMPNAKLTDANSKAEKLREVIAATNIKVIDSLTASFGVTNFSKGDTIESFIKRACCSRNRIAFLSFHYTPAQSHLTLRALCQAYDLSKYHHPRHHHPGYNCDSSTSKR
jgi:diguanylate cyclase (GGDEF)-like protein